MSLNLFLSAGTVMRVSDFYKHLFSVLGLTLLCASCTTPYSTPTDGVVQLPRVWQVPREQALAASSWSQFISSPDLEEQLRYALSHNPGIQQRALTVEIARATLFRQRMQVWPTLDVLFSAERSGTRSDLPAQSGVSNGPSNYFSFSANMTYEVNLWGQLSDAKKAAAFAFAAAQADYEQARRDLVTQVSVAWLEVVEAQQLMVLYSERLANLEKNLNIIEAGYRSGLQRALEVYLARNELERERSRWILQQQVLSDARRSLSRLLGDYPNNTLRAAEAFPSTTALAAPQLPSELLTRRADIQAAWLRVLQQSADLAVAHKARFPALNLTARAGRSAGELGDLGAADFTWRLGASLIQPLLNAGRLKASEDIARLRMQQNEKLYLDTVYAAFGEVESALEKQLTLEHQYQATQQAEENALQAEKLAFDQYLRGIAIYSTVLESQRRAVDAQISLISLKKQIIANQVSLLNAIYGELDFIAARSQNTE